MMVVQIALLLLAATMAAAQLPEVGNSTERIDACQEYELPAEDEQFLDVSFLGDRQYVEVGPVNFTYFQFGPLQEAFAPRTPLVLIVGQGSTSSEWTPDLLKGLAQERQVVIFDNRGTGLSEDSSTDPITIESYAESTAGLFEALELDKPDVFGWSLGSGVALELAFNYSSAINRMVIADTTLSGHTFLATPGGMETAEALGSLGPILSQGMPIPPTVFFPDTEVGNEALCRFLALTAAMPPDTATQAQILRQIPSLLSYFTPASALANTIYDGLGSLDIPTLVIVGQQDLATGPASSVTVAEKVRGAIFVEFPEAGHGAIFQYAQPSAALITAFLDNSTLPENPELYNLTTTA